MDSTSLSPGQLTAIVAAGSIVVALIVMSLWARRQHLAYTLRKFIACAIVALLTYLLFMSRADLQPAAPFVAILVFGLCFRLRPQRKRGTRAEIRRRVIAKWVASTGKKYNPRIHEIDHIVPFAKGGGETEDNLRVIERKQNRSKGAKSPWWDLLDR